MSSEQLTDGTASDQDTIAVTHFPQALSTAPRPSPLEATPATDASAVPSATAPVQFSAQTEQILQRINGETPSLESAKERLMKDMVTSDRIITPSQEAQSSAKRGRGGGRGAKAGTTLTDTDKSALGEAETPHTSTRARGRGPGRPRGSRGKRGSTRGGTRSGKRKREDREDDDDDEDEDGDGSDSSENYTPVATQTKSGRSVQKPASYVPPPAASPSGVKRRRTYRRNPENAVCKVCLRGTSPASNMIVFCDGCNVPYHRYCHHPPIEQAVIDEVDKEWLCHKCEDEKVLSTPAVNIDAADSVAVHGVPEEERRKYFSNLTHVVLVDLLVKATNIKTDLPVFTPDFKSNFSISNGQPKIHSATPDASFGAQVPSQVAPQIRPLPREKVPAEHPSNFPRPGQGLMSTLPPEQEDVQWLVDEEDRYGVFHHVYQDNPTTAEAGLLGRMN